MYPYDCEVTVSVHGKGAPARSMFGLMNLGAGKGDILTVAAEGPDAREALRAVQAFLQQNQ